MVRRPRVLLGVILAMLLIGGAVGALLVKSREVPPPPPETPTDREPIPETPTEEVEQPRTIGTSVEGRPIELFTFGNGTTSLLFVGGIHGGYEWNSVLLAYTLIDYLSGDPTRIPASLSVHVIPSLNPDGVFRVIGKEGRFSEADVKAGIDTSVGRFNANSVDLNRNFACKWQPTATWRGKQVSAGTGAFSEPEAVALRDIVTHLNPAGVIFWHSKANAVYASECENGILPGTRTLMDTYASAAGYTAVDVFDAYPVTGDAEGWLASIGIPAITVELATHEDIEWEKNLRGIKAVLDTARAQ